MKSLLQILRFLLTWQIVPTLSVVLGLVLVAATPVVATLADGRAAFGLSIIGFVFALVLPSLAATVPFRNLISSRRLALVPGFHLRAGLALLLLTVLVALFMPLSSLLYLPTPLPSLLVLRIFIVTSLYMGLMQWLLPSKQLIWAMSLGPFVLMMLMARFGSTLAPLLLAPATSYALFTLCVGGWARCLRRLATHSDYRPMAQMPINNTDFMWSSTGRPGSFFSMHPGRTVSSARTLLLGYPDSLFSRLVFIVYLVVVSPLVCVALLYAISGDDENNAMANPAALFLLFSLVVTIISSMNSGELAARCRLIWLRQGGSRREHWQFMERTLLANLTLTFALIFVIAAGMLLFSPKLPLSPVDYLLGGISCSSLGAYSSLTARISNWSLWLQMLLICVLGPGVALAFNQDLIAIPVLSVFILLLALFFREVARRRFTGIDWYQVKPRSADRSRVW